MSPIIAKTAFLLICTITLFGAGCSDPRTGLINSDTGKHTTAQWSSPDKHGAQAKAAPSFNSGFAVCQECHREDYSGGISNVSCLKTAGCHGANVNAPHAAAPWRGGARTHASTDPGNAPVCAQCHTNRANTALTPVTPAPTGAPGCFNNTLCHAQPGHAAGWNDPAQHGAAAKAVNGFSGCEACHGTNFAGLNAAPSCLQDALCHGAVTSPHPPTPWRTSAGSARTHTDSNTSNAAVCADCHVLGANLTSVPVPTNLVGGTPGCFSSTLCHGQVGHPVGPTWIAPAAHGAAAQSLPSVTNMTGFSTCQTCHANDFTGGTSTISCLNTAGCHGAPVSSPHAQAPWVSSLSSTMTHTTTDTANAAVCGLCHIGNKTPSVYSTFTGTVGCFDNTLCHPSASAMGCVYCHTTVQTGTHGTPRDAVVGEFGLAWGHKKSGRGAVTDADCIVCHLEGQYSGAVGSAVVRTAYHKDGNIDLRDPDGSGETPITDISGGAFLFTKFSTTYVAGSRTSTGHTSNNIDNVLTQKFCLACHDSNGANNPTARTASGTAFMPWGGVNLGANYTVANGAAAAGGVINVKSQLALTNSSVHPVLGSITKDFPYSTRLAVPYNNIGTARNSNGTTGHTTASSVVINCFDCHNAPSTPLTNRTIVAHGNANTLRGTTYATTATLCTTCHTGYTTTGQHGTGSAWAVNGSNHNASQNCHYCHGSNTGTTKPARPLPAQDYHGNNSLVGGGFWPTVNSRPYAFIRGWSGTAYHRPYRSSEFTTGNATCGAGTCPGGGQVGDGNDETYTPGGTY